MKHWLKSSITRTVLQALQLAVLIAIAILVRVEGERIRRAAEAPDTQRVIIGNRQSDPVPVTVTPKPEAAQQGYHYTPW